MFNEKRIDCFLTDLSHSDFDWGSCFGFGGAVQFEGGGCYSVVVLLTIVFIV